MSIDTSPWNPMDKAIDIKHMGKLGEELCEAGAATFRCIIQGIDEREPETGKPNREWLEDELADVLANIDLVNDHFNLNTERMRDRSEMKKKRLRLWHQSLEHYRPTNNKVTDMNIGRAIRKMLGFCFVTTALFIVWLVLYMTITKQFSN